MSCLYEGSVRHRRMEPMRDEFSHRLFMTYLDLDELPGLFDGSWLFSARRRAAACFRRSDYLGDPRVPLKRAVGELVAERTGSLPQGPIRLLTHMRCFGHCFNPVSFYYCFDASGEHVVAVVADVMNTPWGERHAYVLAVSESGLADHGSVSLMHGHFDKALHVSPLMGMEQRYDWRLTEPGERLAVHIESHPLAGRPGGQPTFDATLALRRTEITSASLRSALARYPLLSMRIIARIYAHALRLKLRGARYFPHPSKGAPST